MQNYFKGYAVRAGILCGLIGGLSVLVGLMTVFSPALAVLEFCTVPLILLADIAAGVLAVRWSRSSGAPTIRQGTLDGAVAGGIAGAISLGVKFIQDSILTVVLHGGYLPVSVYFLSIMLAVVLGGPLNSAINSQAQRFAFYFVLLGVDALIGIIIAIILAVVGAMVYTAVSQLQKKSGAS